MGMEVKNMNDAKNENLENVIEEMRESTLEKKIAKVRRVANEIYDKKHELTANDLLEYAKPENSEIHDCFPWDDADIANKARLWLANQYIARVKVKFINDDEDEGKSQRVFRSVKVNYLESGENKSKRVYKRIDDIMTDEIYRKQVIADLVMRQDYWAQEAKDFSELKGIVNEAE